MKKYPVSFIHVSDLHLDTTFPGIQDKKIGSKLHGATFTAFQRLIALCLDKKPDFLLLSGDIYNAEDYSLHAQFTVRDGCLTLEKANIRVFIIHGNHDPLSSQLKSILWPKNVTIFGKEVTSADVTANDGTIIAKIYGISHATTREHKNLALQFKKIEAPCLHIGMLHCTLDTSSKKDRYAPCSVHDLLRVGMDYWALGHIHEYQEVMQTPLIIYPGCIQGLNINEQGDKGCVFITAEHQTSGGYVFQKEFYPLSPIIWKTIDVDLTQIDLLTNENSESIDSIEQQILSSIETFCMSTWQEYETIVIRIKLLGHTPLNDFLRIDTNLSGLLEHLRQKTEKESLWIKDIILQTKPPIKDKKMLIERNDLLSEIMHLAKEFKGADPNTTYPQALQVLFQNTKLAPILSYPNETEYYEILREAEWLCIKLLSTN